MNNLVLFSSDGLNPLWYLLIILGFFGLVVLIIILVKKFVKPLQINKDEISEEEASKQELDRVLIPIEDENIQKQMDEDMNKNGK